MIKPLIRDFSAKDCKFEFKEVFIIKPSEYKASTPKSRKSFYESGLLRLNCNKSKKILNWKTILKFNELTLMVGDWYWNYCSNKKNLSLVTSQQIKKYQALVVKRGSKWAKI